METYKSFKKLPQTIAQYFPDLFSDITVERDNNREFITVAFDGEVPVACVYGEVDCAVVNCKDGLNTKVHINRIEVRESEKRKGYGKALVELIIQRYNPYEIYLYPLDEAIPFWKHMGFYMGRDNYMHRKFKTPKIY